MAYRIGKDEHIAAGLLRILREDLDAAERAFRASDRREQRVHEVRRRLKRIRTILRIVEPAFGEQAAETRRLLSEAGRLLASARDADVAAASARALAETAEGVDTLGFARVADTLGREAAEAHRQRTPVGQIMMLFATAGASIASMEPGFDGTRLFDRSIRRVYLRGRRAMKKARVSLATADLHAWRKQAKQLGYHFALGRERLPKAARRLEEHLDALGDVLGADNDHALLAEKLALMPSADLSLMSQLSAISTRRQRLEADAFALGEKIYRRKADAFARKFTLG